ncbi:hypothetical protein HUV13_15390 [Bacteroides ovatus]|jgi:hypothetical protein|uniref:HEAT repeat domain-containing protein n=2 Tax=root TaxID=1 RepID=A0A415KE11_9BACE|nr:MULTISPECIES: hypothetical protein [Bacteroides]DAE03444.1 MAG TPA: hypothetical protein [Siphoviridae sp. ctTXt1]KAB6082009.1 hypothetical protein GA560_13065 [Bacteroides xylanisolvens]KAB6092569.1 hypothetical protein GA551_08945 [Bacteroides xylanisolvens]KAB6092992.1 hypothetical protein GA562_18290 [Bacteroides xylanisolvens]KAB6111612.1 hypothetical protein GA564_12300 [Bacteroides xylanisolvens]
MQKRKLYGYLYVMHSINSNSTAMNREQALKLVTKLLNPNTPADERQRAAAQLQELIKILLPE